MSDKRKQITSKGIAQQSGLDVFSTISVYNGEYVNFGNAFAYGTQMGSQGEHGTTETNFVVDALTDQPPSSAGVWYRFKTTGSPFTSTTSPTSTGGYFIFPGQKSGGNNSYSGIYQKVSGLNIGYEYKLSIQSAISSSSGTMYVQTWYDNGIVNNPRWLKNLNGTITFPVSSTSTGISEFTFKAKTNNDVLVIYFSTEDTSSINVAITSVSIQERQDYLVPSYVNDKFGNAHKTLRKRRDRITDA